MSEDKIEVAVRVRPLIPTEIKKKLKEEWTVNGNEISLKCSPTGYPEVFTFDYIFDTSAKNNDLYKIVAPLVQSAVDGFNCTIFAYGQTSSGKTHSIDGSPTDPGIIRLAVHDIFQLINNDKTQKYVLRVAYMELYNEKINDLLNTSKKDLKIRMDENNGLYTNAEEKIVCNETEMTEMLQKGNKNRQIGETKMNERSSRSHVICDIIIESYDETNCQDGQLSSNTLVKVSHLYIVDLAGSERIAQTGATGVRLNEGVHINKSLSVLITVINQLSTGQSYVSFRDSKLTRLLSNALGGNSKTLIITAITPASVEDTLSTLKFARSAKTIKNKPRINEIISEQSWIKRYQLREKELLHLLTESKQTLSIKDDRIKRLEDELHDVKNIYVKKKSTEDTRIPRRHTVGCLVNNLQPILETSLSEVSPDVSETPIFQRRESAKDIIDISIDEDIMTKTDKYQDLNESHEDLKTFREMEVAVIRSENFALEQAKKEQEIAFKDRTAQLMKEIEELKKKCDSDTMKQENEELKKRCADLQADNEWITQHQKQRYENRCEELLKRIDELESNKTRPRIGLDTEREETNKHLSDIFSKLKDNIVKIEPYENGCLQRSMSQPNIHKVFSEDDATKEEIFQDIIASLRQWCSIVLADSKGNNTFNSLLECLNNVQVNDIHGLKRSIGADIETVNGNLIETEGVRRISDLESELAQSTELVHMQSKFEALQKELSIANAQKADLNKELSLLVPQLGQLDKLEDELSQRKEQINQLNKKLQHLEVCESQKIAELEKVHSERINALTVEHEQRMNDKNNMCEHLNKQVELLTKEKEEYCLIANTDVETERTCKDLKEKYAIACAEYEDTIQDTTKQLELRTQEMAILSTRYEEALETISALKTERIEIESLNDVITQKTASVDKLEAEVSDLKQHLHVANDKHNQLKTEYENVEQLNAKCESKFLEERQIYQEEIETLKQQILIKQDKIIELESSTDKMNLISTQYDAALQRIAGYEKKQASEENLNTVISQNCAVIETLEAERKELQQRLKAEKDKYEQLATEYESAEQLNLNMETKFSEERRQYQVEIDALKQEIEQNQNKIKENAIHLESQVQAMQLLSSQYHDALGTIAAHKAEHTNGESLKNDIDDKIANSEKFQEELKELEQRLKETNEKYAQLSTDYENAMQLNSEIQTKITFEQHKFKEEISALKEEFTTSLEKHQKFEDVLKERDMLIDNLNSELEKSKRDLENITVQFEAKHEELLKTHKEYDFIVSSLRREIDQKTVAHRSDSALVKDLKDQLEESVQTINEQQNQIKALKDGWNQEKYLIKQSKDEYNLIMSEYQELLVRHETLENELAAVKQHGGIKQDREKIYELENTVVEQNQLVEQLQLQLDSTKAKLDNITMAFQTLSLDFQTASEKVTKLETELNSVIKEKNEVLIQRNSELEIAKNSLLSEKMIHEQTQAKYTGLQADHSKLQSAYQSVESELTRSVSLSKHETEVNTLTLKIKELESLESSMNNKIHQNNFVEDYEREKRTLLQRINELAESLEKSERCLREAQNNMQMREKIVFELEERITNTEKERLHRDSVENEQALIIKTLKQQVVDADANLNARESEIFVYKNNIQKMENEIKRLQDRVPLLEKRNQENEYRVMHEELSRKYEQKIDQLMKEKLQQDTAIQSLKTELSHRKQKIVELEKNLHNELEQLARKKKEYAQLSANYEELQKTLNNMKSAQTVPKESFTENSKEEYEKMKIKYKIKLCSVVKRRDELEAQVNGLKEKNTELGKVIEGLNKEITLLKTEISITELKTSIRCSNQNKTKELWIRVDKELYNIMQKINLVEELATFCNAATACDRCQKIFKELNDLIVVFANDEAVKQLKSIASDSGMTRAEYITFFTNTRNDLEELLQDVVLPMREVREFIKAKVLQCYDNQIQNYHAPLKNLQCSLGRLNDVLKATSSRLKKEDDNFNGTKCSQCAMFQNSVNIINSLSSRFCYDLNLVCKYPDSEFEMEFSLDNIKRIDNQMEVAVNKYREFQLNNCKQPNEESVHEFDALKERYARLKRLSQKRYQQIQILAEVLKKENYTLNFKEDPITIVKERGSKTNENVEVAHEDENPRPPHGKLKDNSARKSFGATPRHLGPFFATPEEHREQLLEARRFK